MEKDYNKKFFLSGGFQSREQVGNILKVQIQALMIACLILCKKECLLMLHLETKHIPPFFLGCTYLGMTRLLIVNGKVSTQTYLDMLAKIRTIFLIICRKTSPDRGRMGICLSCWKGRQAFSMGKQIQAE